MIRRLHVAARHCLNGIVLLPPDGQASVRLSRNSHRRNHMWYYYTTIRIPFSQWSTYCTKDISVNYYKFTYNYFSLLSVCYFALVCLFGIIIIINVLPKGRSFTANSGIMAAVLPKGRSSTANPGTKVASRCSSFPLLSALQIVGILKNYAS